MYDVIILCLMLAGISAVAVFSYKIFRSRVYPVGMVRKIPLLQAYIDERSAGLSDFGNVLETGDLKRLMAEGCSHEEIATVLHISEPDVKDLLQRVTRKLYAKGRSGPHSGKRQYYYLAENPFHERGDSALEEEVVEHGEALKLHSKQFEEIDKRIRRLEIESVQKLQEATEEKPQPPRVVH